VWHLVVGKQCLPRRRDFDTQADEGPMAKGAAMSYVVRLQSSVHPVIVEFGAPLRFDKSSRFVVLFPVAEHWMRTR